MCLWDNFQGGLPKGLLNWSPEKNLNFCKSKNNKIPKQLYVDLTFMDDTGVTKMALTG